MFDQDGGGRTVTETLDIVGDDVELAEAALDAELGADSPRSTLIGALRGVIEAETSAPPVSSDGRVVMASPVGSGLTARVSEHHVETFKSRGWRAV